MRASALATFLLGCALATVSPGAALADPLGDAAASGWGQNIADSYRGFVPPGVSPIAASLNGGESMRRDTPCRTGDAAAKTDVPRKMTMKVNGFGATCGDAGGKTSIAR